jgi:hypothetical protein
MSKIERKELVEIEESTNSIVLQVEAQQIETQTDVDSANIILKAIAKQMSIIEAKRKTFTQPLNQSLREINSTFKELTEPLKKAKGILSGKVMDWRDKEQKRIRMEQERIAKEEERRRKIQEAHKKKGHEVSEPIVMAKPQELKETDSTNIRKVWKFEIIDAIKIPRRYLIVDESFIRAEIRNGVREIPGVRIYQEEIMVIK